MTRRSRSSASALEETTFTGRIVSIKPNDGRRIETCEILMKVSEYNKYESPFFLENDWKFTGEGSRFIDVCYRKSVAVNDIVQFRLMDLDNKKIPICIDEATPYQREEFEGNDAH